jgi:hypothetical protein
MLSSRSISGLHVVGISKVFLAPHPVVEIIKAKPTFSSEYLIIHTKHTFTLVFATGHFNIGMYGVCAEFFPGLNPRIRKKGQRTPGVLYRMPAIKITEPERDCYLMRALLKRTLVCIDSS